MKTYKDGLLKALEILQANECDADGYHYCSQQDTYKSLIQAEIDSIPMDAPVKHANGGLDLDAMRKRLDEVLARETPESLTLWIYKERLLEIFYDLEDSALEEQHKKRFKTFIDGIDSRLSV